MTEATQGHITAERRKDGSVGGIGRGVPALSRKAPHEKTPGDPSPLLPGPGTIVAFDTEGSGLYVDEGARISVVSLAWRDNDGELQSTARPYGQAGAPAADLLEWQNLMAYASTWRLVMHNAAHDLPVTAAGTVEGWKGADLTQALYWDTMLAERILEPLGKISLEHTAIRRFGAKPWKYHIDAALPKETQAVVYKRLRGTHPWSQKGWAGEAQEEAKRLVAVQREQRSRYDRLPWSTIEPYATEDAVNTLLSYEAQVDAMALLSEGEQAANVRELRLVRVLVRMEMDGVGFDCEGCRTAAQVLEQMVNAAEEKLPEALRPVTPHRMRKFYYDDKGYLPVKTAYDADSGTTKPVRSVDDYSRKGLADQGAPWIDELNEWITLDKALSMWYRPWPEYAGDDQRLRMRVRQAKVTSGRLSSERVSLLAIPHETPAGIPSIRQLIIPRPGHRLVEVDLSQAEPRIGSVAAGCTPLLEEYRKGEGADVYAKTALELFGVDRTDPQFNHWRQLCKRLVLASLYAVGAKSFTFQVKKFMNVDMSEDEAMSHLRLFRAQYPQFKRAERYWDKYVQTNGYVPLALGARRYFTNYEPTYKAFNQRVQASVSVGMKESMLLVEQQHPGTMLVQTHDSLMLELEREDDVTATQVAGILERTFTDIFRLVPFVAEIKEWAA